MDLVRVAYDRGLVGIALSRASWLRGEDRPPDVVEVPVIVGRTMWDVVVDASRYLIVVEEPNYFGRFEPRAPVGTNIVNIRRDQDHADTVADTRHLAASLRQIPGLQLPHGPPESGTFIVSLPGSAAQAAELLANAGFPGCASLGRSFAEFPGGMHIRVAWPRQDNARFCTIVRSAI